MKQTIRDWFPNGELLATARHQEGKINLPLSEHGFWQVDEIDLTERERFLVSLFREHHTPQEATNPWQVYLMTGRGEMPQDVTRLQFLHARLWTQADGTTIKEWLEMMAQLLPHQVAHFQLNQRDHIFVLDQGQLLDVKEVLVDTIEAMEFDFGLRMTLFLGQIWARVQDLPRLFQAELDWFDKWQSFYQSSTVLTFSQLFLWGQAQASKDFDYLAQTLSAMIMSQDQLDEIILALWKEGAVLTKAAQRLYIHRNTLQYRLDRWHEISGLQLKELTDLSLCYNLILSDLF
ncbi:PucR family transcriptional regulator [Streptococcus sp. X16XC17]|uniref:helix-turn-helix domain-containing protein n=1 Tax=unclassified Streptococcus TaxID=2608887 RepID=UPI00069FFCD9|nr:MULTISPECIES: helix-turn-helix domain-containing protein [unclassified Streptococcus]TCD45756.1 PucR family transcriptional regulator [Streptococcus sp. X16XC17]